MKIRLVLNPTATCEVNTINLPLNAWLFFTAKGAALHSSAWLATTETAAGDD